MVPTSESINPLDSAALQRSWPEYAVAALGFLAMLALVLSRATSMLEPDDYAYQASIVALSHGEILLSTAQYHALAHQLSSSGLGRILQWHQMASGKWISEKNPGYPFLATPFYLAHALRLAPLFYGALGAFGLFVGARAWLGRWAGAWAVWLFSLSGAALVFAWRATMSSFTDASLIACGAGLLLWVLARREATPRARTIVGLLAFVALEAAVFVRYTDVIELIVAVVAVIFLAPRVHVSWRTVGLWMVSVAAFVVGTLVFDAWAYGSAFSTGYSRGEITFSLSALWPNLRTMPLALARTMPLWLIGASALVGVAARAWRHRHDLSSPARRDAVVAGLLALGWLGLWALYFTYTWTVQGGAPLGLALGHGLSPAFSAPVAARSGAGAGAGANVVHVIRFYLPAIGPMALLGAWLLRRIGVRLSGLALAGLALAGVLSFHTMAASNAVAPAVPGPGSGPVGGPPGPPGARSPGPGQHVPSGA